MNPQNAAKTFRAGASRGPQSLRALTQQMQRQAVAARLRELRAANTQPTIANAIGVTRRAYQAWEAGSGITIDHVKALARHFGVSENYILYGNNQGPGHETDQLDRIEAKLDKLLARP